MILSLPNKLSKKFLVTRVETEYERCEFNLTLIHDFCLEKWRERAKERYMKPPEDLSNSCKFTSMFVRQILGGHITGNFYHQFCIVEDEIVDINQNCKDVLELDEPHFIDSNFIGNRDHIFSLESCIPRLNDWIDEFNSKYICNLNVKGQNISYMYP